MWLPDFVKEPCRREVIFYAVGFGLLGFLFGRFER